MNTRQIEYMLALWEEKSFTKAAKRLYVTPSALNQQLRHLEKELGTALFERDDHSFSLTPSGKIYMSGARNIMNIKEQAMKQINAIHNGVPWISSIRIALHQNFYRFFMDYIYPDFTQKYPSVELSPTIVTDTSARMEVEKQDADLAFIIASGVSSSLLGTIPVRKEELHLAFPNHLFPDGLQGVPFQEIVQKLHPLGFLSTPLHTLGYATEYYLNRCGLKPNILCHAETFATLRLMLNQQFAYSLLPLSAIKETDKFAHCSLEPEAFYSLSIVYSNTLPMTDPVRELIFMFLRIFDFESGFKNLMDVMEDGEKVH